MFNVFGREFNSRHLHHEQHIRPPAPQPVGFFVSQPAHSVRIRHIRHLDSSDDGTTMSTTTTGLVGRTGMSRDHAMDRQVHTEWTHEEPTQSGSQFSW